MSPPLPACFAHIHRPATEAILAHPHPGGNGLLARPPVLQESMKPTKKESSSAKCAERAWFCMPEHPPEENVDEAAVMPRADQSAGLAGRCGRLCEDTGTVGQGR